MKDRTLLKKRWSLALLFGLLWVTLGLAQDPNWSLSLTVKPYPSPYIADWERDPSIGALSINYLGKEPVTVKLYAEITREGYGVIARGESKPLEFSGPGPRRVGNTEIVDWNTVEYEGALAEQILRSGRIPEGRYRICVEVREPKGRRTLARACADFTIVAPSPPRLIYPGRGDTLLVPKPTFQWTPILVPAGYEVVYRVRLWGLGPRERPGEAMARKPYLTVEVKNRTSLLYPPDAPPLKEGNAYIWQVQALDQAGYPLGENQGKSEVWGFWAGRVRPVLPERLPQVLRMGGFELREISYEPGSILDSLSGEAKSFFVELVFHLGGGLVPHPVLFELEFRNLKAQWATGDTGEVIQGEIEQEFEPPVEVGVTPGFRVDVERLHLWPDSAEASVVARPPCLYDSVGCGPARIGPFDTKITPHCDIYKEIPGTGLGPYRLGDTGILIRLTGDVGVDLSRTRSRVGISSTWIGINFAAGETVEQPEIDPSNTGYLYGRYGFSNGVLTASGFDADLDLIEPWEFTSLEPMNFVLRLNSGSLRIERCMVKGGEFAGEMELPSGDNGVHNPSGDPITVPFNKIEVDTLLNLYGLVELKDELQWGGFGVRCETGKFRLISDPRPFFTPVEDDNFKTYTWSDRDTLTGLTLECGRLDTLILYSSDAERPLIFSGDVVRGWLNLEMQGLSGEFKPHPERRPPVPALLGVPGSPGYLADTPFMTIIGHWLHDTKDSLMNIEFQFAGNSAFDSDLGGQFGIPYPCGPEGSVMTPPFQDLEVTSTASFAGGNVAFSDTMTLDYWGVGITSERGVVSVKAGEIIYTNAEIYEPVHFSKGFNIIWGEMLADGGLGEFYFNHNSANQKFDGFPITLDSAALSRYDPSLPGELVVRCGIHFNFFGEADTLITVHDAKYSKMDPPYYGRLVTTDPEEFALLRLWGSELAEMDFPTVGYDSADQNGFIGSGAVDLSFFVGSPLHAVIELDSAFIRICILETESHNLTLPPAELTALGGIWGCACIEGDELSRMVVGGRLETTAGGGFGLLSSKAGVSVEVKMVVTPTLTSFVAEGMMYLSIGLAADAELNGRVALTCDRSVPSLEGEIYGAFDFSSLAAGLEAEGQVNWHLEPTSHYLQGRVAVSIYGWSFGAGFGGGVFVGMNAPKSRAWVLEEGSSSNRRFGINLDNLPPFLTGVYVFGDADWSLNFGIFSGGIEIYAGAGAFTTAFGETEKYGVSGVLPYVVGVVGVYLHGEILWGVVSASAWGALEIIGPYPFAFEGTVGLKGCVLWVFCASVDLTVGLSSEQGFYID